MGSNSSKKGDAKKTSATMGKKGNAAAEAKQTATTTSARPQTELKNNTKNAKESDASKLIATGKSQCHRTKTKKRKSEYYSTAMVDQESEVDSTSSLYVMKAAYDNEVRMNMDELTFVKGDRFLILHVQDEVWAWARKISVNPHQDGFVPLSNLVPDEDMPQSHVAWFDFARPHAERALLMPGVVNGTYIIRPASARDSEKLFALSVRYHCAAENADYVKNYLIRADVNAQGQRHWFIAAKPTFMSFSDMISHYSVVAGLCTVLSQPYPRLYVPPSRFRDFEINREQIQLKEKLGQGMFGEVHRAQYCGCLSVAVKTLQQDAMSSAEFIKEARIMHKLSHKNVVQLLGVCTEQMPIFIITELMEHGALLDYLKRDAAVLPKPTLSDESLIDIMAQVACGMSYLECDNYIHCDLRAGNILLSADNTAKVADFGLAKLCTEDVYRLNGGVKFPLKWTAPEVYMNREYSTKSDVWSFGVLCYEVSTRGGTPYPNMTAQESVMYLQQGSRMQQPNGPLVFCPGDVYEMMLKCWRSEPSERPMFKQLYEFFSCYFTSS